MAEEEGQGKGARWSEPRTRPSQDGPSFGRPCRCSKMDKERPC